jgi:hypothetical protein
MANKTRTKPHKGRVKADALARRKDDDNERQGITTGPHQNTTVFERARSHLARNLELAFRYASVWVIDYGLLWTLELCIGGETAKYPLVGRALDYTKIAISMFAALMFIIHASINVYKHASEELDSARRIEKP